MSSPFPGMDPYVETPEIWRDFHHNLASEIQRNLNPHLGPRYYAAVEVSITYELRLDYSKPPPPPALSGDDAAWVAEILRSAGKSP